MELSSLSCQTTNKVSEIFVGFNSEKPSLDAMCCVKLSTVCMFFSFPLEVVSIKVTTWFLYVCCKSFGKPYPLL